MLQQPLQRVRPLDAQRPQQTQHLKVARQQLQQCKDTFVHTHNQAKHPVGLCSCEAAHSTMQTAHALLFCSLVTPCCA